GTKRTSFEGCVSYLNASLDITEQA
ncbi:unnamed protein product, partial [methanotrophic bacterial endosymbiont of Bathymodiolus sp.]